MKHFIPAWYTTDDWWRSQALPFHRTLKVNEFDELISLMNIHLKNKAPFEMMVLNYSPNLRLFLHRQELFEATYWSLFDEIQGFTHQTPRPKDYRQFNWPNGTEFVHSLFLIRALTGPDMYSEIQFSQEGYLLWIETFEKGVQKNRCIFDDRGFISSFLSCDAHGQFAEHYYMTANGDWIMKEDLLLGGVTIHPDYAHRFKYAYYDNMPALIDEYINHYKTKISSKDVIITASDVRHNPIISRHFSTQRLCFSVYQQRENALSDEGMASIKEGPYCLIDTMENERRIADCGILSSETQKRLRITPFDVRITPNVSNQLHESLIGVWIDGIDQGRLVTIVNYLINELECRPQTRVIFLTRREEYQVPEWIQAEVNRIQNFFKERHTESKVLQEFPQKGKRDSIVYASLKSVPFEIDVAEAVSTLRLVIDLNEEPDLFLQICCLGAGLPQISRMETDYVKHGRNGYVISNDADLTEGIAYFLDYLKHWNHAYAYAMKLAKAYESNEILKMLDDWLEGETHEATL
ncbi:accessory Sec system protein Asp1 [Staphylococcus pseudintermedius]|nr:accessory Sec system protein Asp1 [Staphylococcus pseudintermedius]